MIFKDLKSKVKLIELSLGEYTKVISNKVDQGFETVSKTLEKLDRVETKLDALLARFQVTINENKSENKDV